MFWWVFIYICMGVQWWIWLSVKEICHSQDTRLTITFLLSIKQSRWTWHLFNSVKWFTASLVYYNYLVLCVYTALLYPLYNSCMCRGIKHIIITHFIYRVFALLSQSVQKHKHLCSETKNIYSVAKAHFLF